ncbi:hypothetical protein BAE44_0020890, partial [Dichanthelium oligosanthes]
LFSDAKILMATQFSSANISYISRNCNGCAHGFGRMSLSWDPDQSVVWLDPLPEFVHSLVARDFTE